MEGNSSSYWMVENIEYVKKFLMFGLREADLRGETDNERNMSIKLLEEIIESLRESSKVSLSRLDAEMDCRTSETGKYVNNSSVNDQAKDERGQYANVPLGQRCPKGGDVDLHCSRGENYREESIYVSMDSNRQDSKEVSKGETCQAEYVNASILGKVGSLLTTEELSGRSKCQETREKDKLFLSAVDVEEKWKKISADSSECTGTEFQQEAISTLNTMKTQSSVYIKKNSFGFGYLHQRKRKLFGHMWKKVYAVIKKNVMFLYKSEFEDKALEIIILNGYDVFEVEERSGKAGFQLLPVTVVHPEDDKIRPIHRFRCESVDFEVWQKALSFPVRQNKKDNGREMAWLRVAKAFDNSASDENLRATNFVAHRHEESRQRRRTEPIVNTTPEMNRRGRSRTEYLYNSSAVNNSRHALADFYRSPCPLPYENKT